MQKVKTVSLKLSTKGDTDICDITADVEAALKKTNLKDGIVTVNCIGSTASITTIEYEPALVKDLKEALEKLLPKNKSYHHDSTWGDANGYAHLRSSIMGTSKTFAFEEGKLFLGQWQQIIFIDFDNRPRQRTVVLQFIGVTE